MVIVLVSQRKMLVSLNNTTVILVKVTPTFYEFFVS